MKKHLFGIALMTSMLLVSGMASAQFTDIDDIQVYDAAGAPASPLDGTVVTVAGNIFVIGGTYNSGSYYIADATGGITFFDNAAGLAMGDYVEITGTVGSYSGEIQLTGTTYANQAPGAEPAPVELTVEECLTSYENVGSFVSVIGTITGYTGSSTFYLAGTDSTIAVYRDSDTGIDLSALADGDTYLIKGPLVNYNGLIEIKPRQQSDLVENPGGDTVPVIVDPDVTSPSSDYQPAYHWAPLSTDDVTVSATITDDNAVAGAVLYYRTSDGVTPGAWMSTAMSGSGDLWSGVIAGPHTASQLDFYIEATDSGAQTVTLPGNAPTGFLSVAVGMTSIYDMQYVHPDSSTTAAAYNGQYLNIQGVITAGPGQVGAASKFLVQEPDVNPATGTYGFGGVLVYEGSSNFVDQFYPGDMVRIGGECDEYNSLTEMIPHSNVAVNLVSFPHDLPPATKVQTRILADDYLSDVDGNGRLAEEWESVWVKTFPAAVIDTTAYGEWLISDTGLRADSLVVNPIATLGYEPVIGDITRVEGFLNYYYGDYELVPVSDAYITILTASAIDDDKLPAVMSAGGFTKVGPNPFNPMTTISFRVNKDNLVQLNIYDIRGQKVRTLISEAVPANEYTFTWDGTTDDGRGLASGTYFARLRIGTEVMQVKKMQLIK